MSIDRSQIRVKAMLVALDEQARSHLVSLNPPTAEHPHGYHRLVGGGVEHGETHREAVVREVREELGAEIRDLAFLGVLENRFVYDGEAGHEIVFLWSGRPDPQPAGTGAHLTEIDGSTAPLVWRPLADEDEPLPVFPTGLDVHLDRLAAAPPPGTAPVAQALVEWARAHGPSAGGTHVVAVDGPSGSGKTTLAAAVEHALAEAGEHPVVAHMDDLYPGWDGLAEATRLLVTRVLEPLAHGRAAGYERYDWAQGRYAEPHEVPVGTAWLVVEGAGCGVAAARPHLSALAWVEADPATHRRRALARDGEAYRPHWDRWARQESALFTTEQTREHADITLRTGQ